MKQEVHAAEQRISKARTERASIDAELEGATLRLSEKLARRIRGRGDIYIELNVEEGADLLRALLEGSETAGPGYTLRLHHVRTRAHEARIFLTASGTASLGGKSCETDGSGYLVHLDRDLLKLYELQLACETPAGTVDQVMADLLPPLPLPLNFPAEADLAVGEAVGVPVRAIRYITPIQAQLSSDRIVLRAPNVSLKGVKP